MVKLLIENGAYVNFKDEDQATSLHHGAKQGFNGQTSLQAEKNLNLFLLFI